MCVYAARQSEVHEGESNQIEAYRQPTLRVLPLAPRVPIKCARCANLNPHDAEICFRCGFALSAKVAFRRDDELQRLKEAVEQIESELGRQTDLTL